MISAHRLVLPFLAVAWLCQLAPSAGQKPLWVATAQEPSTAAAVEVASSSCNLWECKANLLRGEAAIKALEDNGAEAMVADATGTSVDALRAELDHDSDLVFDQKNTGFVYVCKGMNYSADLAATAVANTHVEVQATAQVDDPDPPISEAFSLHSRPGSSRLICKLQCVTMLC